MKIIIRKEKPEDYKAVFEVIKTAFKDMKLSDHSEHFMVERLRKSAAFIPELSLVAVLNDAIVGHILVTKIQIKNQLESFDSLALAPVSVLPNHQNQGIGGLLIKEAHKVAKHLGHQSIVLLGHEKYYPRFGYELTAKYGISLPFEVPEENCMIIELVENALTDVNGIVEYPKAFFE